MRGVLSFTHLSFFTRHSEAILHRHSEPTGEESQTNPNSHSECEARRISEFNSESIQSRERKPNDK